MGYGAAFVHQHYLYNTLPTLSHRQGRVSYQALKRRFDLDDDYLEDLKGELLFAYSQVVAEEGRGLDGRGGRACAHPPICALTSCAAVPGGGTSSAHRPLL
jgi:hypothetical protein